MGRRVHVVFIANWGAGHCARVHREVIVNGNDEAHESTRCIVPGPRTWRRVWSARAHTGRAAHGSFFFPDFVVATAAASLTAEVDAWSTVGAARTIGAER